MGSGRSGAGGGGGGGGVSISYGGGGYGGGYGGSSTSRRGTRGSSSSRSGTSGKSASGTTRASSGKAGEIKHASQVERDVHRVLSNLPQEYLTIQFGSPLTRNLYEALFDFKETVVDTKSWDGIRSKDGISPDAGCLRRWARNKIEQLKAQEANQKVQETAASAFENFLVDALNGQDSVYVSGRSETVLSKMNEKVFGSTSAIFLAHLLRSVLERQAPELPDELSLDLFKISQAKADRIVERFEKKFLGTRYRNRAITHRELFNTIQANMVWFVEELRRS